MSIKFLPPLRLLNPSPPVTRFPLMNVGLSINTRRSIPIFSRVFPKFKYPGYASQFSTRSFRPGPTGSRPEFSRRTGSKPERGEVRTSKSLVEDEAEISDWVSDLRTSSFRGRLTSEDESDSDMGRRYGSKRGPARDRDSGSNRGVAREGFSTKRRRESDSDEFGEPTRRRTESTFGPPRKNRGTMGLQNEKSGRGDRDLWIKRDDKGVKGERGFIDHDDDVDGGEGERKGLMRNPGGLVTGEDSDDDDDDDDDNGVFEKNALSSTGLKKELDRPSLSSSSDSFMSETRFDQCSISPLSLKGIKDAGYEKMTVVQAATLPAIVKGKDVLAKAKTGTGKTVAFLLPSIEVVVKSPPLDRDQKRPPIIVLVICPTRELATQAATEANKLLKYHPSIGVQVVIGGVRIASEQRNLQANPCQILVATPGRLKDHIENTSGFATRLMGVKVLVLDEADRLLDMGFRKDIEKIITAIPKQRQTLMFSATVPEEVRQICHTALKRDHEFINTVEEGTEDTHSKVRQMHVIAPLDKQFPLLYVILKDHIADDPDYKVIVFCTTARVTGLVAGLLGELNLNIREIHSRKGQAYRTRVSDEFRKSRGIILVTSDVSARGVDYPDVTLVIQVGLPASREQYIHRLGRTGRKGKEGEGILLLAPWEEFFLSTARDLPITEAPMPSIDPDTKKKVERALSQLDMNSKQTAYQAWLGYYNSQKKVGNDKYRLVELANEFSRSMGLDTPPAIPKLVLGKMGLRNIPGLRSK
ncbi:DEAD-BOX ATP-DEPENDENT RNA HELICASE 25 [Salix koriyanagi]|uniref:ATP-dependent RNA helicase n=1 Tax=Salix koriyanagi TaxID=2511006 RepID=A0A9Q0U457_9ROSI|nr:DEAD-BOX ATP-DEPENDENT RNA HELICASE 25 [Salix koriyanagi]